MSNNVNSLQSQINSINQVNAVQNSDIATLKTQIAGSGGSGALMCSLVFNVYRGTNIGYCLNVKRCCTKITQDDNLPVPYFMCQYYGYNGYSGPEFQGYFVSVADCGSYMQI
ncbi:Hypothetical_protein [Hexamita inflata]|uniref:Hypothetical_protein n=1 Tax=Hexamita inflata TaxID=28002 RepID=A0AA86NR78_9EUKA|nr:Hypothetical protein HINF_LOCUS11543 [Hexamita inflata]CAI9925523.1 Hypothetical protein HINF_LOCUS13168 [Hexamita inflata]CAI9931758.1 Hypothetical protein HINF_LOCUS19403 [Hexamita inflata]CAI9966243.1 Hypothetical protein HINF_LOCUS53888 [Hexamita inflata]